MFTTPSFQASVVHQLQQKCHKKRLCAAVDCNEKDVLECLLGTPTRTRVVIIRSGVVRSGVVRSGVCVDIVVIEEERRTLMTF